MSHTCYTRYASPVGELLLLTDGDRLTGLYLPDPRHGPSMGPDWRRDDAHPLFSRVGEQLSEYFRGERQSFDVPLGGRGTPFQQRVWEILTKIPYGATWSYGQLAGEVGNPKACRAVGLANGRNPISIIVPCHRVIGANGSLTGYGGGLPCKQALLAFETAVLREGPQPMPPLWKDEGPAVEYG